MVTTNINLINIHIDELIADQYTAIVYLTPDQQPEDEIDRVLTPNLNDEQRTMSINTPYKFPQKNAERNIIKSY